MRHPFDVAWSPEASSNTPARCSSSWYFAISLRAFSSGITPASESWLAFTTIMNRMVLSPQSLLLLLELRLERITEVVRLEHLANLYFTFLERGPLQPLDGLVQRLHLPQPEARDQLLRLGEGPVDHRPLAPGEPDARALGARLQPLPSEHHARFLQLDVELPHFRQDLFVGEDPGLRVLVGLDQHHESHRRLLLVLGSTYTTSDGRRDRQGGSSPPDPLSLRERGNVMSPPSPERRGGKRVRTDERAGHE